MAIVCFACSATSSYSVPASFSAAVALLMASGALPAERHLCGGQFHTGQLGFESASGSAAME